MELEDEVARKKNSSPSPSNRKSSPIPKNGKVHNLVKVQGTVTDLENKLFDVQRENKELQKEIKLLQRI